MVYSDDLEATVEKVVKACKPDGKVIFYTYRDVLLVLKIINLLKLKWITWVGDLLPKYIASKLERINHPKVSVGVLKLKKLVV